MTKWLPVLGFWFMALALACQSGDDDDSTVTADDDAGDDSSCASCDTTAECTDALGAEWGCVDGCCVFYGDDGDDDADDDDDYSPEECTDILTGRANEGDCYWIEQNEIEFACSEKLADCTADCFVSEDDCEKAVVCVAENCQLGIGGPTEEEEFEHFCGEDTNHDDVTDGDFSGRVVLVQPGQILEGAEQVWRFNVCNMTAMEVEGDYWIGYFKLRLPNQDWEFVVPVPRPDSLQGGAGEWTTDGPQNTDGIPFVEWVFVNQPQYDGGDIREMQYLAFDVPLVSASIVVPGDSFEFVLEPRDGAGDFSASGSVQIQ